MKPICLIVTGGTFDKEYDERRGELAFRGTHLQELLELGRCRLNVRIQPLFLMDSLEMTDLHRSQLLAACRKRRKSGSLSPTALIPWRKPPYTSRIVCPGSASSSQAP